MSDFNSSLPIRTENDGDVVVKIADASVESQQLAVNADGSVNITDNGASLTVDGTVELGATTLAALESITVQNGAGASAVNIQDGGNSLTVDAADLDIRDLDSASDSVEVLQATHDSLNLNANLQVGDADVANGNPVPVSDAGGSLTVDATDLDIRNLVFATDKADVSGSTNIGLDAATLAALESITVQNGAGGAAVNIQDGGNSITVDASDLDIRDLDFATDSVDVSGSSVTVSATDLDIRDLTHASDSVKIGDGTDFLAINSDGSINVVPQEDSGTETVDYDTQAALAGGGTDNHDLVFASASKLYQIWASASGKLKITVQIETGSATNTFNTVAVGFNSTANPNIDLKFAKYAAIPSGARVRVIRQNADNQAQDVYSTIIGILG